MNEKLGFIIVIVSLFFNLKRRTHKPLDKMSSSYICICGSTHYL